MIEKKHIYFLGIGGIGMSALAQYFKALGHCVAGYDRTRSYICKMMEMQGIEIHYEDSTDLIPHEYKNNTGALIIYTPAIPEDHKELLFFESHDFEILKRSDVLGLIVNDKKGLAIAGSHGKTSVSSICANIMSNSEFGCSAFLGGISKNINSNLIINEESIYIVAEADEFDKSFHKLRPSTALITYIESDHLDIYNSFDNLFNAFIEFANLIKTNGNLIISNHIPDKFTKSIRPDINIFRYGLNDKTCNFYIDNVKYKCGNCFFDIIHPKGTIQNISYNIGGGHNLENALAAASIALVNNVDNDTVKKGLETFAGVERRFDIKIKTKDFVYIDDYAHHPTEITAFINAVKLLFPEKKITGVFQPHLYSRTKDFYKEFAKSLSLCDKIILIPIYPAREEPIQGITSELILENITIQEKYLCKKDELIPFLKTITPEVLITMGAGDIDQLVKPIENAFRK